jgi:TolB-like protein/Flp pilus assembly protein TadD
MNVGTLIGELKRRRVFRVLVGYGIVAFAVLQVVEPIQHALSLSDSMLKMVVVLLALGFPVAVVLAWAFDVNAGAIERAAPAGAPGLRQPLLLLILVGIGLLAAAPGAIYYLWMRGRPGAEGRAGAAAGLQTIAVLPFVNMSGDKDNEYFSDGISEEILNVLAQTPGLQVPARTSSFAFKGKDKSASDIAHELEVRMVLEGSVRKQGERVRITAQLIDAKSGFHVWSQTYDRELKDIFAIQEEIAHAIATQLKVKLGDAREPPRPTTDLAAYDLYLRGLALWQMRGQANLDQAERLFREATARDPGFAKAWAGVALVETIRPDWFLTSPQASYAIARDAAEHALALDSSLPETYVALGMIAGNEGRLATGHALFERAKALAPSYAPAWHWGSALSLFAGDIDQGIEETRRAVELDPKSAIVRTNLADALFLLGRDEEAVKTCDAVLADVSPWPQCTSLQWRALVAHKDYEGARRLGRKEAATRGEAVARFGDELIDALEGKADAAALAARLLPMPDGKVYADSPTTLSNEDAILWFVAAGRSAEAISRLERLASDEPQNARLVVLDRHSDPLRCEPRFAALTKRTGFTDPWAAALCGKK